MWCVCGDLLDGHVCSLSHRERMIRYADYCIQNNIKNICDISVITPFSHSCNGCVVDGVMLERRRGPYYANIKSTSKKYDKVYANVCNICFYGKLKYYKYYCFVNMEFENICHETKPLRVLLVREIYNQQKVPRDIQNLINSLLSCGC